MTASGSSPLQQRRRQADRGHRVARRRLGDHPARVELGQLRDHGLAVRPAGHDEEALARQRAPAGRGWPGSSCGPTRSGRAGTSASPCATAATAGCPRHRPAPPPRTSRSWAPRLVRRLRGAGLLHRLAGCPRRASHRHARTEVFADRSRIRAAARVTRAGRWSRSTTSRRGERVELSVATYANWVAKTASLLVEEATSSAGSGCWSTSRRTGSPRCSSARRGPSAWRSSGTRSAGPVDGFVTGPTGAGVVRRGGRAADRWSRPRCFRWACGSPSPCRDGCDRLRRRGVGPARRLHRPGTRRPRTTRPRPAGRRER